jgi:hypothetical protein
MLSLALRFPKTGFKLALLLRKTLLFKARLLHPEQALHPLLLGLKAKRAVSLLTAEQVLQVRVALRRD